MSVACRLDRRRGGVLLTLGVWLLAATPVLASDRAETSRADAPGAPVAVPTARPLTPAWPVPGTLEATALDAASLLPGGSVPWTALAAPPAFGGGGLLLQGGGPAPQLRYYAVDALGSVRVVFDATGAEVSRADYEPFGAAVPASTTGMLPRQQYTGHERDGEVGVDYFGARMYTPTLGRMPSVDPLYSGAVENPQRWNRYAYALNNPLSYVDPDGRMITCAEFAGVVRCNDSTSTSRSGSDSGGGGNRGSGGGWGGGGGGSGGGGGTASASSSDCMARTCTGGSGGGRAAASNPITASDVAHAVLDVAGMVPVAGEAADIANAGIYLLEGDLGGAATSLLAAVPVVGNLASVTKVVKRASSVTLFRAVSPAEASDIARHGFRTIPGTTEGKWFTETVQGAERFRALFPGNSQIVQTTVPRDVYDRSFKSPNLDGLGPCVYVSCGDLSRLGRQR